MTDLFEPTSSEFSTTAKVMADYPLAKLAAADLRGREDSLAIEEVIRTRFRDSDKELDQRIFRGIPPYLQELLHHVSHSYTRFPQNYQSLVTNLLRLDEVVFISLNYDVILDEVLATADPQRTNMQWYIKPRRHWSLIKLHGSVDWARDCGLEVEPFHDPPADMDLYRDISLRPYRELWRVRGYAPRNPQGRYAEGTFHYPALSVPVGQADELVCPRTHVEFLQEKLAADGPLHLLLVGYSGNDREVLALIREAGKRVVRMTIVDRSRDAALAVAQRLSDDHGIVADSVHAHEGDFTSWVEDGALNAFVETMRRA